MLVLLSMFIADTNPHRYIWIPVDLPAARNAVSQPGASREDAVRITVVRDGTIYLQLTRVFREDLGDQLRDIAKMKVYLAVDKRARMRTWKPSLIKFGSQESPALSFSQMNRRTEAIYNLIVKSR
jgi:biopolymer transport protein ExbD